MELREENRTVSAIKDLCDLAASDVRERQRRTPGNQMSDELKAFASNYFSLDQANIAYLSSNKILQAKTPVQNLFRHVIQRDTLDRVEQIDLMMRLMNGAMVDAGLLICRISYNGVSDWKRHKKSNGEVENHRTIAVPTRFSLAEWLGRLVFYGFDIVEYRVTGAELIVAVMKTRVPKGTLLPSSSLIYPMKRVGYKGKEIKVYKIRTMYPFSEYLQSFIVSLNGYNNTGKPAHDFRITPWGRFLRKYWLDEIPQLLNLIKGDMGIVGVRPLSVTRFNELPDDVQQLRIQFKPGCVPPYVALCMPDSNSNIEAERIYMDEKRKSPYSTDVKYFFKAVYNILSGKIVSS